jgi:hypothetical protein
LRPVPPVSAPTPKPQPDQFAISDALDSLGKRVESLESKMSVLFKRSVVTVVLADVLLGALKFGAELLTK